MLTIIKVLHVVGSLKIGGLETIALSYYSHISKDNFKFFYLVFGDDVGELENSAESLGAEVIRIPRPSRNYLQYFFNLIKIFKEYDIDIAHSHILFNSGIVALAARFSGVKKRIVHSHSASRSNISLIKKIYHNFLRTLINKNATTKLASSKAAAQYLFGEKKSRNAIVINNSVDEKKYYYNEEKRRKIREEYNLDKKFVLGHVGRFNEVKNQAYLIEVIRHYSKINGNSILLLIGDGITKEKMKDIVYEYKLEKHVLFLGNQNNVDEFLCGIDLFLFPSLHEGLGISLIEAQACDLPCIISEGVPDEAIISDSVKRISLTEGPLEWAKTINEMNRSAKRAKNGFLKESGYDIESMMKTLLEIYA